MSEREIAVPRATYRLQLNKDFTFRDAADLAPYMAELGVSHVYLSPVLKARRGSTHGYDTVDHSVLNPEMGTLDEFRAMAAAFRAKGLGIVLDIVPNHMGVGGDENALWLDVLEWGPASRYADWFDIDWHPSAGLLEGKILVPFLGSSYAEALASGEMDLRWDGERGELAVWSSNTHKLPLCLASYPDVLGEIAGFSGLSERCEALSEASEEGLKTVTGLKQDLAERARDAGTAEALRERIERLNSGTGTAELDRLIGRQHWRPARYSVAADEINYRRFFIVSDLAGVRVERDEVFEHVHRLTFQLVEEGLVDGLRIDHIDGLFDPKGYIDALRARCPRPIYLVVEKILAPGELPRADWEIEGTTGYEFITEAIQFITDPRGEVALTEGYRAITGDFSTASETERVAKFAIMDFEMAAELDALAERLHALALSRRETRDLTRNSLRNGLRDYVAAMEVYRTYIAAGALDPEDERRMSVAMAKARRLAPTIDPAVFDFLTRVVSGELCRSDKRYDEIVARDVARRVQQFSGPVMAKGLEDTALYRYNRLISLSDVGHHPDRFHASAERFHDFHRARQQQVPHGMLTSSSHDSKRGEDVRARLAVLSGVAEEWLTKVVEWRRLLQEQGAVEPHANDLYYLFQTLLGAWPTAFGPEAEIDPEEMQRFGARVDGAMMKAMREARLRTNWSLPDLDYEKLVSAYLAAALELSPSNRFLQSFRRFEARLAAWGAQNGLIVTLLKLTVPGVPDIYQGAEFWEQSLVDPDNRRPVDFAARERALASDRQLDGLIGAWRDGDLKQRMIATVLALRASKPELFAQGSYEPLELGGDDSLFGFRRRHGEDEVVVLLRRFPWRAAAWAELSVPESSDGAPYAVVFGDGRCEAGRWLARFDRLPVFLATRSQAGGTGQHSFHDQGDLR
jgi:(1->4)-alpha-D-glucan 1-alpha-D-glucosylmutase